MVHENVLQLVKMKGPVIPSQISREIGTNILLASAILSEMVSNNVLRVSSVKIGGSPLYYLPGQEARLQEHSSRLHEKEKKAYEMLKESGVLRDKRLDPVVRVALRQIKDFAKPLEVTIGESKELFWKWYLLPTTDAEPMIKSVLEQESPVPEEKQAKLLAGQSPAAGKPAEKPSIAPLKKQVAVKPKPVSEDAFSKKVKAYFEKNSIEVVWEKVIKKRTETDFIVRIPSAVGGLEYYCKARDKKRCSDSDLSAAYVQGQSRKLPVLFVTTGDLTKKAKEMFASEFEHITFKKI